MIFFPEMHGVATVNNVVIRCFFNNNFYFDYGNMLLINKVVRHIFCFFVVKHHLAIYVF